MPKNDFVTTMGKWPVKKKSLTEEELNEEFKRSKFKSHQAFLAWKVDHRYGFEVNFWEWMESTSTKYDEDGSVYHKRPGEPGLIYKWLLSGFGSGFNIVILMFLFGLILISAVTYIS